jgi:UDP-N-acetylglucosamine 2-epimerase
MKKILFISSSRADYGLLRNIILETKKNKKIKVFVLVTGSHLSKEFGNTIKEIEKDGLKKNIIKKRVLKKNFYEQDISKYISQTITSTSSILEKIKPEKVVIL